MSTFETKDSGKRKEFSTGMQRDISEDKARFDLLIPVGQPYDQTFLYRWAMLMMRGAKKYDQRNWEQASTQEELDRFRESAIRHFFQWFSGDTEEDHAVACAFNLMGAEYVKEKIKSG